MQFTQEVPTVLSALLSAAGIEIFSEYSLLQDVTILLWTLKTQCKVPSN